jgi:hypothetical protein
MMQKPNLEKSQKSFPGKENAASRVIWEEERGKAVICRGSKALWF